MIVNTILLKKHLKHFAENTGNLYSCYYGLADSGESFTFYGYIFKVKV